MWKWNQLPEEVVEAGTITTFKRYLDKYMDRKGLDGLGPNAGILDSFRWGTCDGLKGLFHVV